MKRLLAALLPLLLLLSGCCFFLNDWEEPKTVVERELGLTLEGSRVLQSTDTHGRFLGDGKTLIVLSFEESGAEQIRQQVAARWNAMPLSEPLYQAVYESDGLIPIPGDGEEAQFPRITDGYWYLEDRQGEDPSDGSELFSRASFNFTLAIYDCEDDTLYFIQVDT